MVSADGRVVPLAAARDMLADGARLFVRPDADSKLFDGGVYDRQGLAEATGTRVDDSTPVIVASPIAIEANCFNAARFYAADARRIVEAVNAALVAF